MADLVSLRREARRLYADARQGRLSPADASKLANILGLIARLIESGDLERRLERLEAELLEAGP